MLMILVSCIHLEHTIHLELMLSRDNCVVILKQDSCDKFGILWYHYEIINKKRTSSKTKSLINKVNNLTIVLSLGIYDTLGHNFFGTNYGIIPKNNTYDKRSLRW